MQYFKTDLIPYTSINFNNFFPAYISDLIFNLSIYKILELVFSPFSLKHEKVKQVLIKRNWKLKIYVKNDAKSWVASFPILHIALYVILTGD